ncbi:MAG: response regulator [Cyclobacteriaceae bacterium]
MTDSNFDIRIILVDDEKGNILTGERLLNRHFEVITALNGQAALEILRQEKERIDCLITDIRMPVMGGAELIQQAKKILPDLKIIVVTGFSMTTEVAKEIKTGLVQEFVQKPIDYKYLTALIQKLVKG